MSSLGQGPCWTHYLAAPDPTSRSWLAFGGCATRAPIDRGVKLLHLGSQCIPRGCCGASLLVGGAASRHVPSADILCRRFDGIWAIMPGGGVMACSPMSSCLDWEMGRQAHMKQI
jgi:hypothetical protein